MKAITILEPWASLIACGAKKIETRSWRTHYRGKIAIHAAKSLKAWHMNLAWEEPIFSALKEHGYVETSAEGNTCISYEGLGCVIAIADLVDCARVTCRANLKIGNQEVGKAILENDMIVTGKELAFGDFTYNRYAWKLDNVQPITPIAAKGQQRLWNWDIPDDYFLENFYMGGNKNE
ncbi:ASCH domain-containing protein [Anaerosinus massiliensis]|uniref:ASCH domain-containing protein n=1 Tax=Massilibacillus massiliensis TaxID=1806837 RepID=UPI000DA6244B|nr:ASCH domain-containing protein [Massilibacillus massiliensis]